MPLAARGTDEGRVAATAAGVLVVVRRLAELPGRTVVIAPTSLVEELHRTLLSAGIDVAAGVGGLDATVGVMTATQVKGLEFDHVVVAEPGQVGSGASGLADLYVALTRATSALELVRTGPLPPSLTAAFPVTG